MEMKAYIVTDKNVGDWFDLPVNIENLQEMFPFSKNYAVRAYELPFNIDEDIELDELNRLCLLAQKLEGTHVEHEIKAVQNYFFSSFEELCEHVDDINFYPYDNMTELARYLILEKSELGEISVFLRDYIDYEGYGRDLEMCGDFLITSHGIFEYKQ